MAPGKPESALSKAKELINVNKKVAAIEVLSDCMKLQKKQKAWAKTHEDVMMLLAELCVDCKKSMPFKETIHQYKNMTFQMNPKSLEDVVKYYLSLARMRTEEARGISQQIVSDIEDLDNPETPENLILNAVNIEDEQSRQDRAILTPWLKFLWESYRQCLELLRNNIKFERLYHDIAQDAYEFCRIYDRKTEFRKLCEILRLHMTKYQSNLMGPTTVQQTTVDTWGFHLETRLKQLDYALKFELYNEAYKAVEDVWNLLSNSSISVKPRIFADYYKKTAKVLFQSGTSYLFHAAAHHRQYFYSKDNRKNMSDNEREALATHMIVATLAVPLPNNRDTTDPLLESGEISNPVKQKTLSMLLHLPSSPTRAKLIKEIENNRVYDSVNPNLARLFKVLEYDFAPLSMAKEAAPMLEWLDNNQEMSVYGPLIKEVIVSKTLIQIGKVYKTMKISEFEKLCPFVGGLQLQKILISLIRNLELPIRLDHQSKVLKFDVYTDLGISQKTESSLISEEINGISSLAKQLSKFSNAIFDVANFIGYVDEERRTDRDWICTSYRRTIKESHQLMIERKSAIEERKEEIERYEEESRLRLKEHKNMVQEKKKREENNRLKEESEQMERKKLEEERAMNLKKITKAKISYLKGSEVGNQILKNFSEKELEEMDETKLVQMQQDERNRIKDEEDERMRKLLQKVDFFQRAMRLEEIPLTKQAQLENYERAQKLFQEKEEARKESARKMHELKLKNRDLCLSIRGDIDVYVQSVNLAAMVAHEEEVKKWELECEQIKSTYREKRMKEMLEERDRIESARAEQERHEEQMRKEEEKQRMEEEKQRKEEEKQRIESETLQQTSAYVPPYLRAKLKNAQSPMKVVSGASTQAVSQTSKSTSNADWTTIAKRH